VADQGVFQGLVLIRLNTYKLDHGKEGTCLKTCLLLLPRPVFPVVSGYSLKNYSLVRILSARYRLTVGVITQGTVSEEERAYYRSLGIRWFVYRIPKLKSYMNTLLGIFSDRPLQVSYYYDRGLQRKVDEEAEKADVLIAALIRTRAYLDPWKAGSAVSGNGKTVVFDMVDSIAMNYARSAASTASFFWRMIYRIEEKRLARYEARWIRESSVTYLFNPEEQKALRKYGRVICLPHGVNDRLFTYEEETRTEKERPDPALPPHSVVFMGKMDYQPNVDAVLWYLKNVHAKLGGRVPFAIVGAYPAEEVRNAAAQYPDVTVTGFVEDPYMYASQAMAMVAPMQSGGGIQNKVLEGMALGKVNIVSSLAAAALEGVVPGKELLIADRPEQYAEILTDMCPWADKKSAAVSGTAEECKTESGKAEDGKAEDGKAERYDSICLNAREYIRSRYTWDKYGEGYIEGIEDDDR